jgi:TolB-like protein/DNA-binding winged helix-turn-helix (wHTH) protein/thioredoxin-like negative regulator of GroEL
MATASDARSFEFGGFRLDAAQRSLFDPQGSPVPLPSRAFDVLLFMVARPGELLDKAAILKAVWPTTVVEEGNLSQCIFALRRAFGDTATEPRFIATVPGRGYQFVAQVRESPLGLAPLAVARLSSRRMVYAGAALALGVALFVAFRFWPVAAPAKPSRVDPAPAPSTIAVLPFEDLSQPKDMEYFAEGLAEEIISSLSKGGGLRVISRRSTNAFKGKSDDAQSIGEKLRVATILEGSVRNNGDRIRISAQLTRTADGVSLWAETYDRKFDDVLDIQGSIAREVASALARVIGPGGVVGNLTSNAEAYRSYLRGVFLFSRWIDHDPEAARAEFLRAVQLDPQFAKAQAMLARTYQLSAILGIGDVEQNESLASAALQKAMKLDPSVGDLWWVRMMFIQREEAPIAVVARDLERAVEMNPDDIHPMLWLGHVYLSQGKRRDALQIFERAYETEPLSPVALAKTAWFGYQFAGDRQRLIDRTAELERMLPGDGRARDMRTGLAFNEGRAIEWDQLRAKSVELDPTNLGNHFGLIYDYAGLGAFDAAMYHAQVALQADPQGVAALTSIAHILMMSGNLEAARRTVQEEVARDSSDSDTQTAQAELAFFTGDCAQSVESFARAKPGFTQPEGILDLFQDSGFIEMYVWCLRRQGKTARVAEIMRVFNSQFGPPYVAGIFDGISARMAAATGDRDALVAHLRALANSRSPDYAFVRHDPTIRPYLKDSVVVALLDTLDARRAEFRKLLPMASTRVRVPESAAHAGS